MGRFVAGWIDSGILFLVALFLLRFYFKPKAKGLYKKKWVLLASFLLILYCVVDLAFAYRDYRARRVPSKTAIEQAIRADNTLVTEEFVYKSPQGYAVLIPKGWTYTECGSGPVSLIVVKDTSSVAVARTPCAAPLDKTISEACDFLKKKNPTYSFGSKTKTGHGTVPGRRIELRVMKGDVPVSGIMVFLLKDGHLYQMICSCPQENFRTGQPEFERIIASLTVGK